MILPLRKMDMVRKTLPLDKIEVHEKSRKSTIGKKEQNTKI